MQASDLKRKKSNKNWYEKCGSPYILCAIRFKLEMYNSSVLKD